MDVTPTEAPPGELERDMRRSRDMVRLTLCLHAATTRDAHNLLEALRFLSVGTRLDHGCLGCSAWLDVDSTVHWVEEWETEEAMRRRVHSDRFTSLLAVLESAQEGRVQFDFVTTTRGLDYVMEIRAEHAG